MARGSFEGPVDHLSLWLQSQGQAPINVIPSTAVTTRIPQSSTSGISDVKEDVLSEPTVVTPKLLFLTSALQVDEYLALLVETKQQEGNE